MFITFGNNDAEFHDQASFDVNKLDFYNFMYQLWFVNHAPNRQYQAQVRNTFMNGGYYSIDLTENLTMMSKNTMYDNKDALEQWLGPAV